MKTLLYIFSMLLALKTFSQIPQENLIFWLPFNNSIKDECSKKTFCYNYNVTLVNDRYGKNNSAGNFNGSAYVRAIDSGHLNITGDKTISAWFYIPSTINQSNYPTILGKHSNGNYYPTYGIQLNETVDYGNRRYKIDSHFGKNSINYTLETKQLYSNNKDKWINILYTYSAKTGWAKTYWNGVISDSVNHGIVNSNSHNDNLYIGRNIFGSTTYFNGYIDDVAIYDKVLTKKEIELLIFPCNLISQQLSALKYANNGFNTTLSINSNETSTIFQWQILKNSYWTNLKDSGQFSGTSSNILSINTVLRSVNQGQKFRCILKKNSCSDTTNASTLVVVCPNLWSLQPIHLTIDNDNIAKLIAKTYYSNTTKQWQYLDGNTFFNLNNFDIYSGVTNDTLIINKATKQIDKSKYRCLAFNQGCIDTSNEVILTVNCPKIIIKQPDTKWAYCGDTTSLVCKSIINPVSFQWQVFQNNTFQYLNNNSKYSGVNTDSLIIKQFRITDDNLIYRCVLHHKGCFDTSQNAKLTFKCPDLIKSHPDSYQITKENNTVFIQVASYKSDITYQWQVNKGTGFENILNSSKYSGINTNRLTVHQTNFNENKYLYRCEVSYLDCKQLSNHQLLEISCDDIKIQNQTIEYFKDYAILECKTNYPDLKYQWQSDIGFGFINLSEAGQYIGTKTNTLRVENLTKNNHNQKFRCIAYKNNCSDTSALLNIIYNDLIIDVVKKIEILPNPTDGYLKIINLPKRSLLSVYNDIGQKVYIGILNGPQQELDFTYLAAAMYMFVIKTEDEEIVRKIIIY